MADAKKKRDEKTEEVAKLRLMVNKRTKRIAYAEAEKDMIDALLSILVMPAGAIAKRSLSVSASSSSSSTSGIENLYKSIQNMPEALMKTAKEKVLDPKAVYPSYSNKLLGISPPSPPPKKKYYTCYGRYSSYSSYNHGLTTSYNSAKCRCGNPLVNEIKLVDESKPDDSASKPAGFVRKKTTFVITDDFEVFPLDSTAVMADLWMKLGVRDTSHLEERYVSVTAKEILSLLKASLTSTTALNDVFKESAKPKILSTGDLDAEKAALQELLAKLFADALVKHAKAA